MTDILSIIMSLLPILIVGVFLVGLRFSAAKVMPVSFLAAVFVVLFYWQLETTQVAAATVKGVVVSFSLLYIVFGAIFLLNTLREGGDHGWHLGENGTWSKLTNYEWATRVPLIITAPGNKYRSASSSALVELVDIYPTLCELAGLDIPKHVQGTSLVPVMQQPNRSWKTAAFSQFPHGKDILGRAIRTNPPRVGRVTNDARRGENCNMNIGNELWDFESRRVGRRHRMPFELFPDWLTEHKSGAKIS